jgi:glutaredoxin
LKRRVAGEAHQLGGAFAPAALHRLVGERFGLLASSKAMRLKPYAIDVRIDTDPAQLAHMMAITGRRTVPQIFIGDVHVGGCDDLVALDGRGGLQPLLHPST